MSLIRSDHIGPDPVGRGADLWRKSNVGLRCSQVLHDLAVNEGIQPPELLGGMTEALIAFIQAMGGSSRREIGQRITDEIMKRMTAR